MQAYRESQRNELDIEFTKSFTQPTRSRHYVEDPRYRRLKTNISLLSSVSHMTYNRSLAAHSATRVKSG